MSGPETMTTDTAVYTVTFPDREWTSATAYENIAHWIDTSEVEITTRVENEQTLIITVVGSGYVIPLVEDELVNELPNGACLTCTVE